MRLSPTCATTVAGFLSILAWAAPLVAQGPTVPRQPTAGPPASVAPPAPVGTSVVVIDVAFIFKNHIRFNARMQELKKEIEGFEGQVKAETTALQQRAEQLKSYAANSPEYRKLEGELAQAQADIQVKMGHKKREFLEREARVYYDVYKEIESTVQVFCQQYRIGLVLRFNGEDMKADDRASVLNGVNKAVVFQQNLDITEHILLKLNGGAGKPTQPPPAGAQPTVNQGGRPVGQVAQPPAGPGSAPQRPPLR